MELMDREERREEGDDDEARPTRPSRLKGGK